MVRWCCWRAQLHIEAGAVTLYGALLPSFIRERKLGIPVSSQETTSQSMMALLPGTRASGGRNDLNRLVMSAPFARSGRRQAIGDRSHVTSSIRH